MPYVLFQVQYIQTQGAKIGLKVSVNAPQILIPCNSKSNEMLVADLGQLHIDNSIVSSSQYGLIDKMDVRLSSFQVSGYAEIYVIGDLQQWVHIVTGLYWKFHKSISLFLSILTSSGEASDQCRLLDPLSSFLEKRKETGKEVDNSRKKKKGFSCPR